MYQVTDVLAKNKKYIIKISSEKKSLEFKISEDLFLDFRLLKGKTLAEKEFSDFKKAYSKDEIYQKTLNYALYKPRCTYEIIEYLKRNNVDEEDFKYHLHKLYKSKILDDERYARSYINDSIELKKLGLRKIIFDLENKHIKKDIYEPLINNVPSKTILLNLDYLLAKKVESLKQTSMRKASETIIRYLLGKGYDLELVQSAINKSKDMIETNAKEDEALLKDIELAYKKYKKETDRKSEKVLAFLLRKGYTYHKIKAAIGEYDHE